MSLDGSWNCDPHVLCTLPGYVNTSSLVISVLLKRMYLTSEDSCGCVSKFGLALISPRDEIQRARGKFRFSSEAAFHLK